jgi:hypothetical protein
MDDPRKLLNQPLHPGQVRKGSDYLERPPPDDRVRIEDHRCGPFPQRHPGAAAEQEAEISADQNSPACSRGVMEPYLLRRTSHPGAESFRTADLVQEKVEGKIGWERKRRPGEHRPESRGLRATTPSNDRHRYRKDQSRSIGVLGRRSADQAVTSPLRAARYSCRPCRTASSKGAGSNRTGSVAGRPVSRVAASQAPRAASSLIS